jgi:hypothetical protein
MNTGLRAKDQPPRVMHRWVEHDGSKEPRLLEVCLEDDNVREGVLPVPGVQLIVDAIVRLNCHNVS